MKKEIARLQAFEGKCGAEFGGTVNPQNPPMPSDVLQGQENDFDKQVNSYHEWLDSVKVMKADGELGTLCLQERINLMERSVIKQAQELQSTKVITLLSKLLYVLTTQ